MTYSFDKLSEEYKNSSIRWQPFLGKAVIPLTVADMSFSLAPVLKEALQNQLNIGYYGYSYDQSLIEKIQLYLRNQYAWEVSQDDILLIPGVVNGLNIFAQDLVDKDEHVIIPSPIYQNCFKAFEQAKISYDFSPLQLVNDRWAVNLEDWEVHRQANTKAIMFCNPHNPTGTVFRRDELLSIANFCENNDLIICSDEIHAPLIIDPESRHIPIASLSPEIAKRTVTLMSLNKAFNFPGVGLGWCVCQNAAMRAKIQKSLDLQSVQINSIAQLLTSVALQSGGPWRNDLLIYLRQNNQVIRQFLAKNSLIKWHKSEATFLAWLDFSGLGTRDIFENLLRSGVALSPGEQFGVARSGFLRLNYAVPQADLNQALSRIQGYIDSI